MDESIPEVVPEVQPVVPAQDNMINLLITENKMTESCHINRDDVARESSLERNALAGSAQAERLGLENLNKIDADTQNVDETVQRFGFANLNATRSEGGEGRAETERFGFKNIEGSEAARHSSETYGYRNVVATKDAEKEVLEAICGSTAGLSAQAREILMSQTGGFKDVLLQAAQNTAALQMSMCEDSKQILLQACENTDAIKSQSSEQFKDVLLQSASNASAVALQNALNAKDAEISRTINAKDAALSAAINYERLFAQGDRNAAALQASIAECCCEQKELVIERTGHTDALIRSLDEGRVKEQLLEARFKILALENKIPTVTVAA
jgi:hypothetical protein